MSEVPKNLPAIISPQESVEWSSKTKDYLTDIALKYRADHNNTLPSFQKGGLQIALGIVTQAFIDGHESQKKPPKNKAQIQETVRTGMTMRKAFLINSGEILKDFDSTAVDLAIPQQEVTNAREEYRSRETTVRFDSINRLLNKADERSRILPILSEKILTPLIQRMGIVDPEQINSYIANSTGQSVIIRGVVAAYLGRMMGIQDIDPLFISDENIEEISTSLEESLAEAQITAIAANLTENFKTDFPENIIQPLIHDYGRQVISIFARWNKIKKSRNLTPSTPEYWEQKEKFLSGFPIVSLTLGVQYVLNKEGLAGAFQEGKPHLWDDAETLDELVVPSLASMQNALSLLQQTGYPTTAQEVKVLREGYGIFSDYIALHRKISDIIPTKEREATELNQYLTENENIKDQKTGELVELKKREKYLKQRIINFTRSKEYQVSTKEKIAQIDEMRFDPTGESESRLRLNILNSKTQRRSHSLKSNITKTTYALERTGIQKFCRRNLTGTFDDPARIQQEVDIVENYIQELEDDEQKAFPNDFYEDPHKLRTFIIDEMDYTRRLITLRRKEYAGELVFIDQAIENAQNNNFSWSGFRQIFLNSLRSSRAPLNRMLRYLNEEKENKTVSLHMSETSVTGKIPVEIQQRLNNISEKEIEEHISSLEINILPEDIIPNISMYDVNQVNRLLRDYRIMSRKIGLRFPDAAHLQKAIIDQIAIAEHSSASAGPSKQAVIRIYNELLPILNNPLFPTDLAEGKTLSKVMNALAKRAATAEAHLLEPSVKEELELVTSNRTQAEAKRMWYEKSEQLREVNSLIERNREQEHIARENLKTTLSSLGLSIPVDEFEQLRSSRRN